MPSKRAQKEIEQNILKETKYGTYIEMTLDMNRKLILKETKSKGCFDDEAAKQHVQTQLAEKEEQRKEFERLQKAQRIQKRRHSLKPFQTRNLGQLSAKSVRISLPITPNIEKEKLS